MPETPNHGYNVPNEGETDWHVPLNENWRNFDTDIEVRDVDGRRTDYDPVQGAKFFATDTGTVYVGDGTAWNEVASTGLNPAMETVQVLGSGESPADSVLFAGNNGSGLGAIVSTTDSSRPALWTNGEDADASLYADGDIRVGPDYQAPRLQVDGTTGSFQFDTPASGGSRAPMMYMYPGGRNNDDQPIVVHSERFSGWGMFYNDAQDDIEFRTGGTTTFTMDLSTGDFEASGNKNFVESVDTDDGEKEVVYTASEAPTPHTELSGIAALEDGRAVIELPDHFGWVTDDDEPIVVQITPYGGASGTKVVERSTARIVVEDLDGGGEYEFAYTVTGTRDGRADKEVVRDPTVEADADDGGAVPADD